MAGLLYEVSSGVLIAAMLLAVLSIVFVSWRNGISPMPSSALVRRAVMQELKRISKRGLMVEAGSGWGTLALQAGRIYSDSRIVGVENSVIPLWISKLAAKWHKKAHVSFVRGDLYTYCYRDVDIVVCYLFPGAMKRLGPILRAQLAPGTHVISICFAIPDWEPERVTICRDLYRTKIYLYKA